MSIPTPGKGRFSGIPTPGKSAIPTPGRFRSASTTQQQPQPQEDEYISRAFADAIKANDPAQHRSSRASDASVASLSVSSASQSSLSGRQSANGRSPSVASSSSAVSPVPPRTPAPASRGSVPRPASRQSDVFARSSSRAGRTFEEGDNVRIESLGFEGTLRYLGEIDGKPGHWAGVELSGGFVGKGKNNGIVNGKQYFVCPPNCGVFVASTKLSAPTVGYGSSRPSSVASSRSGRVTPSVSQSGRITPSASGTLANGRRTPSHSFGGGRVTPSLGNGRVTPSASVGRRTPGIPGPTGKGRASLSQSAMDTTTPVRPGAKSATGIITPGSRASKYVGVTAQQLDSRSSGPGSPSAKSFGNNSPTRIGGFASTHLSSPTHPSSPFNTPKAPGSGRPSGIGMGIPSTSTTPSKSRPSLNTPRPRIPSAIAMPPPASPSSAARSVSLNDAGGGADSGSLMDLQKNQRNIEERMADIMGTRMASPSRPTSSTSVRSSSAGDFQLRLDQMQARMDALEYENQQLRTNAESSADNSKRLEVLLVDQKQTGSKIAELESLVRTTERTVSERDSTIEALERAAQQVSLDIDKTKNDAEARVRDIQSKLDDRDALVTNLKEALQTKEGLQSENDAVLRAKDAEIGLLEARVQKAYNDLEDERRELGGQVDELRRAGQETIALYEERLSAADTRRYELEDLVANLEEQLRTQVQPLSPLTAQRQAASAAEIDNESLREQVQHLQKRITMLEDQLEEAHSTFDREEAAVRERVKRYKEREENMRKELAESKKQVDQVNKSEESARHRVEEMVEALRENTVALENARAEIEVLRNEIADLEGLTASNSSEKVAEIAQRTSQERARLTEEITSLRQKLTELQSQPQQSDGDSGELYEQNRALKSTIDLLQSECDQRDAELASKHQAITDLESLVEERTAELDSVRKKVGRDTTVNGGDSGKVTPSKHDLTNAREEITGLKHIVQELQKEISAAAQRNKVLESENKLLLTETEQLRQDLKVLEESVEQSIMREEQALISGIDVSTASGSTDVAALQRKYDAELEQLRKKLAEAEMKSARTIHDLNKEIGELETLVESKIYREDEFERELERLRDKVARSQKKSSKNSTEPPAQNSPGPGEGKVVNANSVQYSQDVCEICERPGHDIFSCDLLKDGMPSGGSVTSSASASEELFCEDCEGRGHVAENCPHSLDVF
ncbi:uncharacterized protein C8Q71DRAFT_750078 [Rhodofomes roseus]|uniref:CAP-Gly domain-containing protein n=1 Tax=Rhodofomes roseus TaxID=34475 RepID=A0ABQ8KMN0_9APHY|nr:uncharacterized protein C8Q71DRAFT_750078 [Rhodofomes roseus]KAH9839568.1 hypothetical protein C8Q71DRAFT_750078 [Rhodofomes roseus]